MELWDVYDAGRGLTGKLHRRGDPMAQGQYHLIVFVWVFNGRGDVLLTKRAPEKEHFPNLWENTGGSALAGETALQAIRRELFEETGIAADESEFTWLSSFREHSAFCDIFALVKDVPCTVLTMQPGETCDARWVTRGELEQMIAEGLVAAPDVRRLRQLGDSLEPYFQTK